MEKLPIFFSEFAFVFKFFNSILSSYWCSAYWLFQILFFIFWNTVLGHVIFQQLWFTFDGFLEISPILPSSKDLGFAFYRH